jgi:GTPase involved in cell partitioning and DNA repair
MSDEQINQLKEEVKAQNERLVIEEEELKGSGDKMDFAAEFQKIGRQLAETLQAAWDSEERKRVEKEVREGVQTLVNEVDQVIREVKSSEKTAKLKEEAEELKNRVETSDVSGRARTGVAQGLRWLSETLAELANQFTPAEKAPESEEKE